MLTVDLKMLSSFLDVSVWSSTGNAGVGIVGLNLRRTVVVLRSVDVGETAVIRFQCVSQRIEKFGGSHEEKVKRHPVTSAMIARVRIDDERAGPLHFRCVPSESTNSVDPSRGKWNATQWLPLRSHVSVLTTNVRGIRHHQYRLIRNREYPPPPPPPN